jgi:hypothetical protein
MIPGLGQFFGSGGGSDELVNRRMTLTLVTLKVGSGRIRC